MPDNLRLDDERDPLPEDDEVIDAADEDEEFEDDEDEEDVEEEEDIEAAPRAYRRGRERGRQPRREHGHSAPAHRRDARQRGLGNLTRRGTGPRRRAPRRGGQAHQTDTVAHTGCSW